MLALFDPHFPHQEAGAVHPTGSQILSQLWSADCYNVERGGQLPLEAGEAGPAAVTVGQRELSLSDVWDSLMERGIGLSGHSGMWE